MIWRDILKKTYRFCPLFSPLFFFLSVLLRYNWHTLLYLYTEHHYWHFRPPDVWGFFPHIKAIHDINWVSYNLTQFWKWVRYHRLKISSARMLPQHFRYQGIVGSQSTHNFCLIGYTSEIFTIPSLINNNLLEWLTELRKIFCLLDYQFITEGNNSETDTRDAYRKVWGKDRAPCPPRCSPLLHLHKLTNLESFWTLSFGFLWRLHYRSAID